MRLMMKVGIPTSRGNETAVDGSQARVIRKLLADVQPEAAYFSVLHGKRWFILVFEEEDQVKLMQYNEALFAAFDAEVHYGPALDLDDLARGFETDSSRLVES